MEEHILKKYIPMTESTYYALLSLKEPRHGYAIMQFIGQLTKGRICMGTGTLYTMLGRLVDDGMIVILSVESGKKVYQITEQGTQLIKMEMRRLECQLANGKEVYDNYLESDMVEGEK